MPGKFYLVKKGYKNEIIKEYNHVRFEYLLVELIGFLYFFKDKKETLKKGEKFLQELLREK